MFLLFLYFSLLFLYFCTTFLSIGTSTKKVQTSILFLVLVEEKSKGLELGLWAPTYTISQTGESGHQKSKNLPGHGSPGFLTS